MVDPVTVTYNERPFAIVRVPRPAAAIRHARALVAARWHGATFGDDERFGTRAPTREEIRGWLAHGRADLLVGDSAALP